MNRYEGEKKYTYTVIILQPVENHSEECIKSMRKQKAFIEKRIQIIEKSYTTTEQLKSTILNEAKGTYVCFFMSDAFVYPDTFERLECVLQKHREETDIFQIKKHQDRYIVSNELREEICNLWDNYKIRFDSLSGIVFKNDNNEIIADTNKENLFWENHVYQMLDNKMKVGMIEDGYAGKEEAPLAVRNQTDKIYTYFEQYNQLLYLGEEISVNNINTEEQKKVLQRINDELIIDAIGMGNLPYLLWLMNIKYGKKLEIIPQTDNGIIRVGNYNIAEMSYLAVTLHFISLEKNVIRIEGSISLPEILNKENEFWFEHNGERKKNILRDCGMDRYTGNFKYECRDVFWIELELNENKNRFVFFNKIQGNYYKYGKINAERFSPVADIISGQYQYKNGYVMYICNNVLCCDKATEEEAHAFEKNFQEELLFLETDAAAAAVELRRTYYESIKNKKKPIWLFIDRVDRADDNAEAMFRFVRNIKEIESYFIIQEATEDYGRLQGLGNIIPLNSDQHRLLVLMADYIFSSQANGLIENPFREESEYYRDLYHQVKIIFLQHGVTKDDQHRTFNRFNTNFTGFITSSIREKESIVNGKYDYKDEQVWLTGMPRFDYLYKNEQKIILIMPSWRMGLMCQKWDDVTKSMIWRVNCDFYHSMYAIRYRSLLKNEKLQTACKKMGYRIAFMPHALMEPYIDYFVEKNNCLYWDKTKSYRDAFAEGNILVTDYSSVAFDFAFLGKPVVYYQFDKEQFFENHTYDRGYYDYEKDGFGEVLYSEDDLVETLISYMETGGIVKKKYAVHMKNTFAYHDKNACKRIYEKILEGH